MVSRIRCLDRLAGMGYGFGSRPNVWYRVFGSPDSLAGTRIGEAKFGNRVVPVSLKMSTGPFDWLATGPTALDWSDWTSLGIDDGSVCSMRDVFVCLVLSDLRAIP